MCSIDSVDTDKVQGAKYDAGQAAGATTRSAPLRATRGAGLAYHGDALFQYESRRTVKQHRARVHEAVQRAERLIYVEDQYMWSRRVAKLFVDARPRTTAASGCGCTAVFRPGGRPGRASTLRRTHLAIDASGAPDRGGACVSTSKTMRAHRCTCFQGLCSRRVWACVGSDNFNRRSWTHDSELSCAVVDSEGEFARDLRLRLLREHLDRAADGSEDGGLVDPAAAVGEIVAAAGALDAWHESGRKGARPPGRLRVHKAERGSPTQPTVGRTCVPVAL